MRTPIRRHHVLLATACFVLWCDIGVSAAQVCPQTCYVLGFWGTQPQCSTEPFGSRDTYALCPNPIPAYGGNATYDARVGTVRATASGGCYEGQSRVHILVADRFVLEGPATGPIQFAAELHVVGSGDWCGAALDGGAGDPIWTDIFDATRVLTQPLSHPVGEEFVLRYSVFAYAFSPPSGLGSAEIDGLLQFTGLPAPYRITSCQNYSDDPVSTVPMSWGSFKVLFN